MTKQKIAVLTSGGDAPGMNAAIRSIARVGAARGLHVVGVRHGYEGLLAGDIVDLGPRDVSNIVHRGGTILKTSRSSRFKTAEGLAQASSHLDQHGVSALMVIGGDGSFHGCVALSQVWKGQIIGLPGTIDNDLAGTDFTIGYDTAVNTALDAIDKIRDTAEAAERTFLVEVMGRHSGFIAQQVGIGGGAEEIIVPEEPLDIDGVYARLSRGLRRGKASSIIIVAEGDETGGATAVAERLRELGAPDCRVVILGHIQRGGSPTAADRVLATKLGAHAIDLFLAGATGVMSGERAGVLCATPLAETWTAKKPLDATLARIHRELAS